MKNRITENIVVSDKLYSTLLVNNNIYVNGKLITKSGIVNKETLILTANCNNSVLLPFNGYYKTFIVVISNTDCSVDIKPDLKTPFKLKSNIVIVNNSKMLVNVKFIDILLPKSQIQINPNQLKTLSVTLMDDVCIGTFEIHDKLIENIQKIDDSFVFKLSKELSLANFKDIGSKLGKENAVVCCEDNKYRLHTSKSFDKFTHHVDIEAENLNMSLQHIPNIDFIFEKQSYKLKSITLENVSQRGYVTFKNKSDKQIDITTSNNSFQVSFQVDDSIKVTKSYIVFVVSPYATPKLIKTKNETSYDSLYLLKDEDFFDCVQVFG